MNEMACSVQARVCNMVSQGGTQTMNRFDQTIAVLFGGRSSEHEISLRSAVFILKNIPEKYHVIPVGISREGMFYSLSGIFNSSHFNEIETNDLNLIAQGKIPEKFSSSQIEKSVILPFRKDILSDFALSNSKNETYRILNTEASCVFPVLHGQNGEDGRLQGLLELAEMAYVGCDVRASAIGIDKDVQKRLAKEAGVPIAKYEIITTEEFEHQKDLSLDHIEQSLGYPCFVKPNSSGSAVGTGKAKNKQELEHAIKEALAFDQKVIVEEFLQGTEVECAFLGTPFSHRITVAGEISTDDFYSYEEKYAPTSQAKLFLPARLEPNRMQELQKHAGTIAKAMGISGLSRIDFWNCPQTNSFIFNEFNTLPGLTSISMFPKLLEHEGITGKMWIEQLISIALARKALVDKTQYGISATL